MLYVTLIQNKCLEGIENTELFITLQNDQVADVHNFKVLGKKVRDDSAVSQLLFNQSLYFILYIYNAFFSLCFGIRRTK